MAMKYPTEIASLVRKKTFSVDAHFSKREDDKPMVIFDDKFSRFVMTVIADGKAAFTNVPMKELEPLRLKTEYAFKKHLDASTSSPAVAAGMDTNRPAFTVHIAAGNLKGRTPADVLMKEANGKDLLNSHYKWLSEHVQQYPNNRKVMDAIADAAKLDLSQIKPDASAQGTFTMSLLDISVRPLTRRKRDDGLCLIYEAQITWDDSQNYPVMVTIDNFYAPVVTKDNGMLNVLVSKKDTSTEVRNSFVMTAEEWVDIVYRMTSARDAFKLINFNPAFKAAEAAEKEAREAYRHPVPA